MLQEWATLRDSRAALRRAVVVEPFPDDADLRFQASGGSQASRRRSGSVGRDAREGSRAPPQGSPHRVRGRASSPADYRRAAQRSILGTGGRPLTSRALKRATLEQVLACVCRACVEGRAEGGRVDQGV